MAYATLPQNEPGIVPERPVRLTPTEIVTLEQIAQGLSSKEAADRRVVSKRTVDFHLANVYDKLRVNNRVRAIRAAIRLGLIPFEPTTPEVSRN